MLIARLAQLKQRSRTVLSDSANYTFRLEPPGWLIAMLALQPSSCARGRMFIDPAPRGSFKYGHWLKVLSTWLAVTAIIRPA